MAKTYAIYRIPHPGAEARRTRNEPVTSALAARKLRHDLVRTFGPNYFVHVGEEHPEVLPFGATLWADDLPVPTQPRQPRRLITRRDLT